MVKLYSKSLIQSALLITFLVMSFAVHAIAALPKTPRDSTKTASKPVIKISDTRKNKPSVLKNGIRVNVIPFKPSAIKVMNETSVNTKFDDKILSNVKVYPNPVSDELNVNYFISKDVNMTIKIMDFLGNEVATLLSKRMDSGEQTNTFNLNANSKLNSGLYFIRFIAGNETVIKRISVQ